MRVFLAGATGVIGVRLVPLLVGDGHQVAGMTRSAAKADALRASAAEPVVCSLFDAAALRDAVIVFEAEAVMHQVTDLPDERARIAEFADANVRVRREGTRNLIDAARAAGAGRFVAQSIAWTPRADAESVEDLERMVLDHGGVVCPLRTVLRARHLLRWGATTPATHSD